MYWTNKNGDLHDSLSNSVEKPIAATLLLLLNIIINYGVSPTYAAEDGIVKL